ncbi:MAG: hypothetical protein IM638_17265 [Bacteroidetes bacterium]|nr:hypothetical protein [Bacteroidota bacterium]
MKADFLNKIIKWLFSLENPTQLNRELRNRLDNQFGHFNYYYPTYSDVKHEHAICFLLDDYNNYLGTDKTIEILQRLGESTVHVLSASSGDYTIDINEVTITNHDDVFCDDQATWFIFCSHDRTVTVGGIILIEKIQREWTDWESYTHRI